MKCIMPILIAALAVTLAPASTAMAESSTEDAMRSVEQAQGMYAMNGTAAFEMISGSDSFEPFVFVFDVDDFVTVASSDYPDLEGESTFDPSHADHTRESLLERLNECDGLWVLTSFEPEPGTVLDEILWLSEMDGYVFASGIILPDLNLPEWLESWYEEQLQEMVRLLNAAADCECP